jgi:Uma2 family endonuclease
MSDSAGEIASGYRHPITVERYHRMIEAGVLTERDRVELIEGVIVQVSPQSEEHAYAIEQLLRIFIRALGPEWSVRAQSPITLARSEPEPDLVVFPADVPRVEHPTTAPLVVEVAKTSLSMDRALAGAYAEAGVDEYWVVDVEQRQVEVFRDPRGGAYQTKLIAGLGEALRPTHVPGVEVQVAKLFKTH